MVEHVRAAAFRFLQATGRIIDPELELEDWWLCMEELLDEFARAGRSLSAVQQVALHDLSSALAIPPGAAPAGFRERLETTFGSASLFLGDAEVDELCAWLHGAANACFEQTRPANTLTEVVERRHVTVPPSPKPLW